MHNRQAWSTKDYIIRGLKHGFRKVMKKEFLNPESEYNREIANQLIYDLLSRNEPCMIARFGTTELTAVNNYLVVNSTDSYLTKLYNYITDNTQTPWWDRSHFETMSIYSGIFPANQITAEKFAQRYLNDIPQIDLLASFQYQEKFMPLKWDVLTIQLEMLYPFFVNNPWTRVLEGKKVLVVHPFDFTIQNQYRRRKMLFENNVLPDFELITLRAVQSVAGTKVPFETWFDALSYMEEKISSIEFDFCILGCGAYGLPLAAHVKRMGKKAIHIGGGTQLLFGIKGKRWEQQYNDSWNYRPGVCIDINYRKLFNKYWCYPDKQERPDGANSVEGACYW